jgi:geranylgeranyl reductase family protein
MHDVIVIGGGPSGLNAARKLAGKGLDVIVLEKKSGIGKHVICAGIVGHEAFNKFDLSQDSILREIQSIKIVSPLSNVLNYTHPRPLAYAVDRERFDTYLARRTARRELNIRLNAEVLDISLGKNSALVWTKVDGQSYKQYSARVVLIATGVRYDLHRKLGLGSPKDFLQGVQAELNIGPVDCTHVFLGKDIAAGAFAWLVPLSNGLVRVGLITQKNPKGCFHRLIEKYYPEKMENLEENRIQLKPIAQGLVSRTYAERVIALGEAAGQVKTTTGGGIYFGLICSEIAADVVMEGFKREDFSSSMLSSYEELWKKALKKEILVGYYVRKLCAKLSDKQIEKTVQLIQTNGFIPLVEEKGSFDWHSDLIFHFLRRLPLFHIFKSAFIREHKGSK